MMMISGVLIVLLILINTLSISSAQSRYHHHHHLHIHQIQQLFPRSYMSHPSHENNIPANKVPHALAAARTQTTPYIVKDVVRSDTGRVAQKLNTRFIHLSVIIFRTLMAVFAGLATQRVVAAVGGPCAAPVCFALGCTHAVAVEEVNKARDRMLGLPEPPDYKKRLVASMATAGMSTTMAVVVPGSTKQKIAAFHGTSIGLGAAADHFFLKDDARTVRNNAARKAFSAAVATGVFIGRPVQVNHIQLNRPLASFAGQVSAATFDKAVGKYREKSKSHVATFDKAVGENREKSKSHVATFDKAVGDNRPSSEKSKTLDGKEQ